MTVDRTQSLTVEGEFITVSLLIWRMFGRQPTGLVERVYDMNPGLADHGPYLPIGATVVIPMDVSEATPGRQIVRLWD